MALGRFKNLQPINLNGLYTALLREGRGESGGLAARPEWEHLASFAVAIYAFVTCDH